VKRRGRVSKRCPEQWEGFLAGFIMGEILPLHEACPEHYEILRSAQDDREGKAQNDSFRERYLPDCTLEGEVEFEKVYGTGTLNYPP